jgi:hypothetical protein
LVTRIVLMIVHHEAGQDYFEIFYIHVGDIEDSHLKVPGTTVCRLPMSPSLSQNGNFCDLKDFSGADLKPQSFEIIRARDYEQREFFYGIRKISTRFWHSLKLARPGADDFARFANDMGYSLIEQYRGAHRKATMKDVYTALSNP